MKMIYAIVHSDDGDNVTEVLNMEKFIVTKLATTGGFLRKGNTTLLIVTEEELVDQVIDIIKKECGKRQQIVYTMPIPYDPRSSMGLNTAVPINVDVGGATIFVVDVERFEKV